MAEIEYLTLIGRENLRDALVVYAGAAPGTHITYLCGLFPEVKYLLVDPAPFQVKASAQVAIIEVLFTDEMARVIASECADTRLFLFGYQEYQPHQSWSNTGNNGNAGVF